MIEIDGSFGEGGGQILRTALSLSLITKKAFRITKIRANRKPKPGLQPQHLMCVEAAAAIGGAKVTGASKGSNEIVFEPGDVSQGRYHFSIGTAGATGLVLHTVYLPLAICGAAPSEVILEGGTHVDHSPCFHFLETTWRAYLAKIGIDIRLEMKRSGFYPRGGGLVIANIRNTTDIFGLTLLDQKPITQAQCLSASVGLPDHVARRQAKTGVAALHRAKISATCNEESWPGGPGSVFTVVFHETAVPTLFFALGARGKPAEDVATEAVEEAVEFANAVSPVDEHSADQLVMPLALAKEPSDLRVAKISLHLTTNVAIIKKFLDREILLEGEEGASGLLRIR